MDMFFDRISEDRPTSFCFSQINENSLTGASAMATSVISSIPAKDSCKSPTITDVMPITILRGYDDGESGGTPF